jgi:hypothetical protein
VLLFIFEVAVEKRFYSEEVLGKTKLSSAAYFFVREQRRRVLTTKLPLEIRFNSWF